MSPVRDFSTLRSIAYYVKITVYPKKFRKNLFKSQNLKKKCITLYLKGNNM